MTRNRLNRIPGRGRNAETVDANDLTIVGRLDEDKLSGDKEKTILAVRDTDGTAYVVDGRHAAARARRNGKPVRVVFVDDDTQLGNQTALERLLGMLKK